MIQNVPIVHAATAWQSPITGQTYILVLNEALWMGDSLEHTLVNPNQLRHFGTTVYDDPTSSHPLCIITEDKEFCMDLYMKGTVTCFDSYAPSEDELNNCPHIVLSSNHPWRPDKVQFPRCSNTLEDIMGSDRNISVVQYVQDIPIRGDDSDESDEREHILFDLNKMRRIICGMKTIAETTNDTPLVLPEVNIGTSDVPDVHTFVSSSRHTDVTPIALSERWGISLTTAAQTIKKTTQKFMRSAILPLSRRYEADRMFHKKLTLQLR